jgi:hypothetical protein
VQLPALVSEQQCGIHKQKNNMVSVNVYVMAHLLPSLVRLVDQSLGVVGRDILIRARKYGMMNDGELDYGGRKKTSYAVTKSLLKICGQEHHTHLLAFLKSIAAQQKQQTTKGGKKKEAKLDDICDAFLLALQYCIERMLELKKLYESLAAGGAQLSAQQRLLGELREIQTVGVDPGIVHNGVCRVAFRGFEYQRDAANGQMTRVPQFRVLNWEMWDFTRNHVFRLGEKGQAVSLYPPPLAANRSLIARLLAQAPALVTAFPGANQAVPDQNNEAQPRQAAIQIVLLEDDDVAPPVKSEPTKTDVLRRYNQMADDMDEARDKKKASLKRKIDEAEETMDQQQKKKVVRKKREPVAKKKKLV